MQMTLIHHSKDISLSPALHRGTNMLLFSHIQLVPAVDTTTYNCPICSHVSISIDNFKQHLQTVHPRNQYICKICHRKYKTVKSLRRHEKTHQKNVEPAVKEQKEPEIPCPQCPKKLNTQTSLYWHVERNHTNNEKTNTCQVCGKELADQALLKRHLETVHSLESATCSICNKTFKSVTNMQRHIAVTHPPEEAEQTCEICNKTFKCSTHLRIHMRAVHSTQTLFNCDICNKEFALKSYMLKHKKTHIDVKEVQCEICYQVYKTVDDAKRHAKRVHMKPEDSKKMKTHKCDICDKEFTRTKYLFFHKKTHVDKTLSCKFCHKLFKCNSHVNRHTKRVHTKSTVKTNTDASFYCDICNKAFSKKKNLVKHIQIHMIVKKEAPCGICNKLFKTNSDVNRHLRRVHMKNMNIKDLITKNKNMKNMNINTPAKIKTEEIPTTEYIDDALENIDYTEVISTNYTVKALEVTEYTDKVPRSEDYTLATLKNTEYTKGLATTEGTEELKSSDIEEDFASTENTRGAIIGTQLSDVIINTDFIEKGLENTDYADKALQNTGSKLTEDPDENTGLLGETIKTAKVLKATTNLEIVIENTDSMEALENTECENKDLKDKLSRNTDIIKAAIESSDFTMEDLGMIKINEQAVLSDDPNASVGSTDLRADIDLSAVAKGTPEDTELSKKIGNTDIIKTAIEISYFSMEDLEIVSTEVKNKVFTSTGINKAILGNLESTDLENTDFIEALERPECSEKSLGNTDIIKDAIESSNFTIEDLGLTEYTEDALGTEYTIEDFGITECTELESTEFAEEMLTSTDFIEKALSRTLYAKEGVGTELTKKTIKNTDLIETLADSEYAKEVPTELEDVIENEFTDQTLESTFFIDVLGTDFANKLPTKFTGKIPGGADFIETLTRTDLTQALSAVAGEAHNKDFIEHARESIEYANKTDDLEFTNKPIANTDIIKEENSSDFTKEVLGCTDYAMNEIKEYTEADLKSIEIKLLKCLKCGIDFGNDVDLHTHLCGGEMTLFLDFQEI
ncbi:protein suppressor of hairy wing-like [Cydia pomonella]|uniref:protein suppressor of hairy wing-like n=1 Tax=Cydia pomonella TaxID=82600 RepID=UPI002ADD5D57|nr:protein suppressor of hairy wing-like [Cydia pomonella]